MEMIYVCTAWYSRHTWSHALDSLGDITETVTLLFFWNRASFCSLGWAGAHGHPLGSGLSTKITDMSSPFIHISSHLFLLLKLNRLPDWACSFQNCCWAREAGFLFPQKASHPGQRD